jgi:DNA polymerase elongation subunit (family B)
MKKKMVRSGKSFRLIDFNVFDEKPVISSCSSEDDKPSGYCEDDDDYYRQQLSRKKKQQSSSKIPKFVIQMYGINEKGETCSISVDDYQPFFYILVLDSWTQENCDKFYKELCHKIGKQGETSIVSVKLVEYNKLYGFTAGKQSKFIHIVFQNTSTMMRVRGLWYEWIENGDEKIRKLKPMYSQGCKLELYESKLPPLLRYFHIHNISPSGWVFIPVNEVIIPENKTTTCKFEYICSYKQIITQNQKETRVPYKICSFDIEASSSHGDFPIPIKTYKRLATQLVDVYKIHSTPVHERDVEIIRRVILAAFGYGTFSDIDLVYPKGKPPSKRMLEEKLIPKLLAHSCAKDDALSIQNTAMTIETMFEKMKEQNLTTNEQDDGGDMDEEPEEVVVDYHSDEDESSYARSAGDDRKDVGISDLRSQQLSPGVLCTPRTLGDVGAETSDSVSERKPPVVNVAVASKKDKDSVTIFDILKTEQYTRDEKIQWINQAFCDEERVGFPQLEGDKVTFIGSTFMRYGEPEPYLNHCVVLNTCDQIPGCVIDTTETEEELLLAWTSLIQKENPDIIIGYNIFGFDYEFMFRRAQENHCAQEFLQLSRKLPEDATNANTNTTLTLDNTKIVLATGEYDLRYPFMSGRLQIDMYTYFRRDFNLASYKLDDVAGQYICDDVKKVEFVTDTESGKKQTNLYTNNITGLHVGDYIHIEISGFTSDYYRDGHKFVVKEIQPSTDSVSKYILSIEGHETELNNQTKSIKWCIAKDDVSVQDIFRFTNGDSADRARVAKYCIQDCNLVHHLMNKIDVITGYVEMSKICSVPISFLIFRGQGIKLTSYVSKKCREKNTLMPDLEKSYDADGYEGAIVLPPKCAMYMDNPVACLDYASLYPSSMISNNLSPDSKVWTKEYDLQGNPSRDSRGNIKETGEKNPKTGQYKYDNLEHLGYKYIDIEFDTFEWRRNGKSKAEKTKVGKKICRWVQLPDHQKSIMPAILEELLKARSDTRKLIKTTSDPFMQNILDKRQLGYKVTANSLYGQCGAKTSTFFEKDVAASTTATGRMMITYAKRIIEEVYGDLEYTTKEHGDVKCCAEYVYGDSVAWYIPVTIRVNRCIYICTIEDVAKLYGLDKWVQGSEGKEFCELNLISVESWTEQGWTHIHRVIRHRLAPHKKMVRITTNTGMVDVTDDHSLLTILGQPISPREVNLDTELLHKNITKSSTDCVSQNIMNFKNPTFNKEIKYTFYNRTTSMVEIAEHYFAMQQLGYYVEIESNTTTYAISLCTTKIQNSSNNSKIQKIEYLSAYGEDKFVYDLTTDNHHFAAGVGNMIVHNTDSVFFTFNLKDPKNGENIRGKKALEVTIEIAQDAAQLCTQFLKPPMELSYEKTLMPFILLSKKRYVGMLYETNPNKGKMKYMGLSLKRRDSCDYLKDVYGGILTILMNGNEGNIQRAVEFLDNSLKELIQGNVSMEKLEITKALRGYYKNPKQIAHAVLAERIAKRDPGNKPKPGDRMKFVHIVNKNGKALQGDKIETPEYILQNKLHIDYSFYITNQLMKPLQQLFGLALEQICEYKNKHSAKLTIRKDIKEIERECEGSIELFMKKREKYCSAQVKKYVFEKYLIDIQNQKNGMQSIMSCFTKK